MITTDDLAKIRKVIREEVTTEVKDSTRTLDHEIRMSRMQLQNEISELDDRMKNVEISVDNVGKDVVGLKKDMTDVKKRVKKIDKNVDVMARLFDVTDVKIAKRVSRIEDHLGLSNN